MNAENNTRPRRIVCMNDERAMVQLTTIILNKEGYEVLGAADGEQGLEIVAQAKPDLIMLDNIMPGMDSLDVLKHLKDDPELRAIPVLFITANSSVHYIDQYLKMGAVDYLTMPFNPAELLDKVNKISK